MVSTINIVPSAYRAEAWAVTVGSGALELACWLSCCRVLVCRFPSGKHRFFNATPRMRANAGCHFLNRAYGRLPDGGNRDTCVQAWIGN